MLPGTTQPDCKELKLRKQPDVALFSPLLALAETFDVDIFVRTESDHMIRATMERRPGHL